MSPIMEHFHHHQQPYPALAGSEAVHDVSEVPMSRTHQYRKVMKPLLERKRRARINRCLDDLKDLMVYALQSEGESITKLEKADVLELTVKHLQKLKKQRMLQANPSLDIDRYRSGFTACATEVSHCLSTIPGIDVSVGSTLLSHLGQKMNDLQEESVRLSAPLSVTVPATSPAHQQQQQQPQPLPLVQTVARTSSSSSDGGYSSGRESVSPRSSLSSPVNFSLKKEDAGSSSSGVWRPF